MKSLSPKSDNSPQRPAGRTATERDILSAYELILGRPADQSGLDHYRGRIAEGLTLEELLRSLFQSDEYRDRLTKPDVDAPATPTASTPQGTEIIDPAAVMARHSVKELNQTADEYYRRVSDATPLMSKPFAFAHETPEMLRNLGTLLAHLHLGKSMTVLDFGGGTGWLSRMLLQLHCRPICCDVSPAALAIARRLFDEHPVIGKPIAEPVFLAFDGYRIDLPDESVDRIISFDAFHHVPNPATVLREFARVLKRGGIAGFNEPGPQHSRSPQSQYEMKNHRVLENDINLQWIFQVARDAGFTAIDIHAGADAIVDLPTHTALVNQDGATAARVGVPSVLDTAATHSIFWLKKGTVALDSRGHVGLAHRFSTERSEYFVSRDADTVRVTCTITNTGEARWLDANTEIFGIVRIGAHLYNAAGQLREIDHFRSGLPAPVEPGQTIEVIVDVPIPRDHTCRLALDLVSEGVSWFENLGSTPVNLTIRRA